MRRAFIIFSIAFVVLYFAVLLFSGANISAAMAGQHGVMSMSLLFCLGLALSPDLQGNLPSVTVACAAVILQLIAVQIVPQTLPYLNAQHMVTIAITSSALVSAAIWRCLGGALSSVSLRKSALLHGWLVGVLTAFQYGREPSILSDQKGLYLGFALAWCFAGLISRRPTPEELA